MFDNPVENNNYSLTSISLLPLSKQISDEANQMKNYNNIREAGTLKMICGYVFRFIFFWAPDAAVILNLN